MKSAILALIALAIGMMAGSLIVRYPALHRVAGRIFQRGELLALVGQRGIFEADVQARAQQKQYCSGMTDELLDPAGKGALLDEVIAMEALRMVAGKLDGSDVAGEVAALKHQFADEAQFRAALRRSGVFQWQLGRLVGETIAGERWIENQIAPQLAVSDAEVQQDFQQHEADFTQPLRIRARHIFLAAPEGSAPEITEAKDRQMLDIAARLGQGEDFAELAATVSEDEASKKNGGDLGFFAADRVPLEFFDAAAELQPNGPPRFLHSHLGFHALQSTDIHPTRPTTLTDAAPEIRAHLSAAKRRSAVAALKSELARSTHFVVQ
ncbi:MAG TPA: peptidylprolyl isomerase [Chthoniobacterales bacterium]|nr:peptidylprolyl isomerase [Chthoniobacterales bacterium]